MENAIVNVIEDSWSVKLLALKRELRGAAEEINKLLVLEDYYRHGHKDEARLEQSLGSFGDDMFDVGSMSDILGRSDENLLMPEERYARVKSTAEALERLQSVYEESPPQCGFIESGESLKDIVDSFEKRANGVAEAFKVIRQARLEARAQYRPAEHDAYFSEFDWRSLDNQEAALCPPFSVMVNADQDDEELFSKVLNLVTSGRPIKVLLLRSEFDDIKHKLQERGRAAALKCFFDIELLPFLLRKVYLLQYSLKESKRFSDVLSDGLFSPRPAILSILAPAGGSAATNGFQQRANDALFSRTFPQFVYDPDRSNEFVTSLELLDNPDSDSVWAKSKFQFSTESGERAELERPLTFADFVLAERGFEGEFEELSAEIPEEKTLPLADYLLLDAAARLGKTPFVFSKDDSGRVKKLVPSRDVVVQTAERMQLWQTLQELAGIRNPYVQAAKKKTEEQLKTERDQALAELKAEYEAKAKEREDAAVEAAMKNLALRLAGMAQGGLAVDLPAAAATSAPVSAVVETAQPEVAAEVSELPWVDSPECTTCDDCININKKIFAFNKDKKAYIQDPKGGPFKDIVKAAEKCPARVIHPGKPQDPGEKDLEKWVKRAEPFQ